MSRTNTYKRFALGAMAGFSVLPLFAAPRHGAVISVDSTDVAWSRVNGYFSRGALATYESQRAKKRKQGPERKARPAA